MSATTDDKTFFSTYTPGLANALKGWNNEEEVGREDEFKFCDVDRCNTSLMNLEYVRHMDILNFQTKFLENLTSSLEKWWGDLGFVVRRHKPRRLFKPCRKCRDACSSVQEKCNAAIKSKCGEQLECIEHIIDLVEQSLVKFKDQVSWVRRTATEEDAIRMIETENVQ